MTRWEYDEEFGEVGDSWTAMLDKRGRDGWELVAVVDDEEDSYRLVFKRPVA